MMNRRQAVSAMLGAATGRSGSGPVFTINYSLVAFLIPNFSSLY